MSGCLKGSPGNSKNTLEKSWKVCGWAISKMFFLRKASAVSNSKSPSGSHRGGKEAASHVGAGTTMLAERKLRDDPTSVSRMERIRS